MGSRPRFRSPCVTAPAHLLPYAPLYPLLPVLTRGAASYPPGLAALCRVPAVLRGLRLARSPLAIASRRPRSSPNPGYCLVRTLRGSVPARPGSPPAVWRCRLLLASHPLSSCRMGRRPRSRGACGQMLSPVRSGAPPTGARQRGGGGARRVDRGRGECPPFGRAAEPARSAACASSGHHSPVHPLPPPRV